MHFDQCTVISTCFGTNDIDIIQSLYYTILSSVNLTGILLLDRGFLYDCIIYQYF